MHNTFSQNSLISKKQRQQLKQHPSLVIWFTGLSGSGKSTLAYNVEKILHDNNLHTYVLDGDNLRQGINKDLQFSTSDRQENLRRAAEIAKLMSDSGLIVLAAFISPLQKNRTQIKKIIGTDILEIYCKCGINTCKARDKKGLYKKAELGNIDNFTGISSGYETPINPDLTIDTEVCTIPQSVKMVIDLIIANTNIYKEIF